VVQLADGRVPSTLTPPTADSRKVPLPVVAVLAIAGAKLLVHLLTNGRYGYNRDELYYLASGRHPAFGYVDYPPVTPLLARIDSALLGDSPWALRLLPSLVGAGLVVLTAAIARELGGGRKAQLLAATAAATSWYLLGSNWLFMTSVFDELCWIAAIYAFIRLLRTGDPRWWLAVGALLGLGLETKATIVGLGFGMAVALLVTPLRSQLRTRWPWCGFLIALVLFAPNLIWQQLNGWPTLDFLRVHSSVINSQASSGALVNFDSGGVLAFLAFQPLLIGLVTLPLWALGWYYLFRNALYRPLGVAALVAIGLFLLVGKAYYPGPLIPVLLAAGCVQFERIAAARSWRRAVPIAAAAMVVQALIALPMTVPVVPESSIASVGLDEFSLDIGNTVGWPQMVAQVNGVYAQLPPGERQDVVIFASNHGEAGAIDLYGPALGLPTAISPALTYWYWKPAHLEAPTMIAVGASEAGMRRLYNQVQVVDHIQSVSGVRNEEVGRPILVCRDPITPLDEAWPRMRSLN
jgi:hypothetical protein